MQTWQTHRLCGEQACAPVKYTQGALRTRSVYLAAHPNWAGLWSHIKQKTTWETTRMHGFTRTQRHPRHPSVRTCARNRSFLGMREKEGKSRWVPRRDGRADGLIICTEWERRREKGEKRNCCRTICEEWFSSSFLAFHTSLCDCLSVYFRVCVYILSLLLLLELNHFLLGINTYLILCTCIDYSIHTQLYTDNCGFLNRFMEPGHK